MQWVDRGPEPVELNRYRLNGTQDWVDYIDRRTGDEPPSHWGKFRAELGRRFCNKCGYCERQCDTETVESNRAPTVDHFKPRNQFPGLTYYWTNWVFSCRQCNVDNKQDKWFRAGYVDPCAENPEVRPERYFDYDAATGQVIPKPDLDPEQRLQAVRTINDIGLNAINIMWDRFRWVRMVEEQLNNIPARERPAMIDHLTAPSTEFSGVTKMFLQQYPNHM